MGCLKLHIESTLPTLKVVYNGLKTYEKGCESVYRYGFQGQEKDDEIKGEGNSVNYTYRMHDTRLGRFFAIDPLTNRYQQLTPYQFSSNSVISMVEVEGLEGKPATTGYLNAGIVFTLPRSAETKNDLKLQMRVNFSFGISAAYSSGLSLSTSGSVNLSFVKPNNQIQFKKAEISGLVLAGVGDNLDFKQDFSLMPRTSFTPMNMDINQSNGTFVGGGFKIDANLERKKIQGSNNQFYNTFKVDNIDLSLSVGDRSDPSVGATTLNGIPTSSAKYRAIDLSVGNIFNDNPLNLSLGGSYQQRSNVNMSGGVGLNIGRVLSENISLDFTGQGRVISSIPILINLGYSAPLKIESGVSDDSSGPSIGVATGL